jgi:hypoxanthine phosphoribosyltransferase
VQAASGTVPPEIERVIVSEQEIADKVAALAAEIDADYAGREILVVGVLKGAVMFMADLARALRTPVSMEFMAVSSYGSSTSSSGVVRILKDLDRDIVDKHVLVVEDIIDSGLTLSWLLRNLASRQPASLEGRRAAAQARGREGRGPVGEVRRVRHRLGVRRRLRARLRRALPRPALRRPACARGLRL